MAKEASLTRRRFLAFALPTYTGLWTASRVVRSRRPTARPPDQIAAIDRVQLAYLDSAPVSDRPVVILIHGSPGSSAAFRGLLTLLPSTFRFIVPDLPGFGASTREIADYSVRAHAAYLIELMNHLGVKQAQVVGFSMGGGVALEMCALATARVRSIVMLSAIGLQEQELTGRYWANHALHGAQLAALFALREALPHFGAVDSMALSVEYARNFYDTDQRPLRRVLQRYRGPMLILHGKDDWNVPLAAALEHHRLVAQSELVLLEGNHFLTFEHPDQLAQPLVRLLEANR